MRQIISNSKDTALAGKDIRKIA